jgi:hypothetical protein
MAESRPTQKPEIWRPAFLAVLAEGANVKAACAAAGIGRSAAYLAREKSPDFRRQWDDAIDAACDQLEAVAFQRAATGLSDVLLIFLLKSHRPAVYREQRGLDVTTGGNPLDLASLILAAADEPTPATNGHRHS